MHICNDDVITIERATNAYVSIQPVDGVAVASVASLLATNETA